MFLGRESELCKMNNRYEDGAFECVVIYGRRRVGKTALINEFVKDKKTIFFPALNSTSGENLEALSKAIHECKYPESEMAPIFRSYDDALSEITRMAKGERIVFVIDEYPYLAKSEKSISSRLQHIIDREWKDSKLFFILCGSSMSFMEHQVLGYESPLYGRRTAQFKIEALKYREIKAFNPSLTSEEQTLIYGITGGIPHYINKLGVKKSVDEALLDNLFERSSYLFDEPENLLKQELREPALYNSIITAIAGGASRLNEISTKVGIESGICNRYVTGLIELGILKKETPVTEKAGKKTVYRISDNFFRFWYRFVPQNIAAITSGRIVNNYPKAVKQYLPDYLGLTFERICRDYLLYYAPNLPIEISDVGEWWGTDANTRSEVQIDIVAPSVDGKEYIIGSCKYRNEAIGSDELELLRRYAAVFGKGEKYHYMIFSKGGFTDGLKKAEQNGEVTLVTLDDVYR